MLTKKKRTALLDFYLVAYLGNMKFKNRYLFLFIKVQLVILSYWKAGRSRLGWEEVVRKEREMETSWEGVKRDALNRLGWRRSVHSCVLASGGLVLWYC